MDDLLTALAQDRRDRGGVCTTSQNVIAFVENDEALLAWMARSGESFGEAHGFRIILLDASHGDEARAVRTQCKECGDTTLTSLEHIQIGVRQLDAVQLRSIAHDLLVPNVRTVLLWAGTRLRDERFTALCELAQRIVLFSSAGAAALQSLQELCAMNDTPLAERIRDLAYMRLLPWQDLTAQFFDEPDLAEELPSITRVEIASGSEPEAYYLAAWLAGRLGWQPCAHLAFCNPRGDRVRIDFHKQGRPRRVSGVALHTSGGCRFGVTVDPDADDVICLTVTGCKARPPRCVPLHDVDIVSLVERAIFEPDDGGVYLETLAHVRRLLELRA